MGGFLNLFFLNFPVWLVCYAHVFHVLPVYWLQLEGLPSDMYNGIGLTTPRGSGTNGFVQRNFAAVRSRQERVDYKTDADIARMDKALNRKPNKEILEHEWKRRIELECFQMQEDMEEQGWVHSRKHNLLTPLYTYYVYMYMYIPPEAAHFSTLCCVALSFCCFA